MPKYFAIKLNYAQVFGTQMKANSLQEVIESTVSMLDEGSIHY